MVIDADDGLAFDFLELFGHRLVMFPLERHAVALSLPIGRTKIEKRVHPVVAVNAQRPIELLDVGATSHAQMSSRQALLDPQQIHGRSRGGRTKGLASHFPAEALLLQVKEPSRALKVRQGLWIQLVNATQ